MVASILTKSSNYLSPRSVNPIGLVYVSIERDTTFINEFEVTATLIFNFKDIFFKKIIFYKIYNKIIYELMLIK